MSAPIEPATILTTKIQISQQGKARFADWQAKLNALIASFPGFVSLEILSTQASGRLEWMIVQRFYQAGDLAAWRNSPERKKLIEELKELLDGKEGNAFQESESQLSHLQEGVTEVFITEVAPQQEKAYQEWIAKIHQVEARFPGFRGVYVQSPSQSQGRSWITLLQFDTPKNLDHWLSSPERQEVLQEAAPLIASLENQRVISPYAGWFASSTAGREAPSVWKQTMLILLVLFPVVMLELKYLSPLTANLNPSLATFIGNAISVTLLAWPLTPFAIWCLDWWLFPKKTGRFWNALLGLGVVVIIYLLEIIVFWDAL